VLDENDNEKFKVVEIAVSLDCAVNGLHATNVNMPNSRSSMTVDKRWPNLRRKQKAAALPQ